jgi:hypothetical protein
VSQIDLKKLFEMIEEIIDTRFLIEEEQKPKNKSDKNKNDTLAKN